MDARRLISLVLVVAGLIATPVAAVIVGICERRTKTERELSERTAARAILLAAIGAVALVSAGIALTLT